MCDRRPVTRYGTGNNYYMSFAKSSIDLFFHPFFHSFTHSLFPPVALPAFSIQATTVRKWEFELIIIIIIIIELRFLGGVCCSTLHAAMHNIRSTGASNCTVRLLLAPNWLPLDTFAVHGGQRIVIQ